jgi:hypothetical protein
MRIPVSALALLGSISPAIAADGTMPARFQGEWAVRQADCALRGGDNTQGMKIGARDIGYYEESTAIKRVTVLGKDSVRYEGVLSNYDGEEPVSGTLRISGDGNWLIGAGPSDGPENRPTDLLRCK